MKFTEESLEKAVVELFQDNGIDHFHGDTIHKEMSDVLLRDDLKQFLLNQYADEGITLNEIAGIIRQLELYPSSAMYESNKAILKISGRRFYTETRRPEQERPFYTVNRFFNIR